MSESEKSTEEKMKTPVIGREENSETQKAGTLAEKKTKSSLARADNNSYTQSRERKEDSKVSSQSSEATDGPVTIRLVLAVMCVTLSSFQFGYHLGNVNAPESLITQWIIISHQDMFNVTLTKPMADFTWSAIVSLFGVGGIVGGLSSGALADWAGRRGGLLCNNILALVAIALLALAKPLGVYLTMFLGRFFIGIYTGLAVIVPIYLTEVSPLRLRGMMGSLHQLVITVAVLVSQILGLPQIFGTSTRWPYIFAFAVIPTILQILTLPMIPESPKFTFCVKGDIESAKEDLVMLRGTTDIGLELETLREEASESNGHQPTFMDMFRKPLRWPMTIAIVLMAAQQLSGINAAMYYSTVVFREAGLSNEGAVYATIIMGVVNVMTTVFAVWLVDHPRAGRRTLLLCALSGMWLSTLLLVTALLMIKQNIHWARYAAIVSIILFVMSFASGAGTIPWLYVSEIFVSKDRGKANAIATVANRVTNVIVSLFFLPINNTIHQYSFLVFTALISFFLYFVWMYVPETKGRSVKDITRMFEK